MTLEVLEQAVVRHIGQFLEGKRAAHIVCPAVYDCRYAALVTRKHFPILEFGGPIEELPWLYAARCDEFAQTIRPFMIGSITGMCFQYLRAKLAIRGMAAKFEEADALVINHDVVEMGRCLCYLGEDLANPIASIRIEEFLSVYKSVTYVDVEFPRGPYWDFEHNNPVYGGQ